jgi:hypothetical protein
LEYLFIAGAVFAILSLVVIQAVSLYNKNLNAIDNRELKATSEKIQDTVDLFELYFSSKLEIEVNPQGVWNLEVNSTKAIISNENKSYSIKFNGVIEPVSLNINKKSIIIIEKKNNKIFINIST